MIKVFCLDDRMEYWFSAANGFDAINKMLYCLNLKHFDNNASINLCNNRTWELNHNENTYSCLA